jgi:site-specific DNA recombinase
VSDNKACIFRAAESEPFCNLYSRCFDLRNCVLDRDSISRRAEELGVELVSVMDYTTADPTGDLVANIIDSINEYQSRINGQDVSIKMAAKAERGGTSGKAPLGYLNVRENVEGREVRTVITDPVRSPLIQAVFREYATGDYSTDELQQWAAEAGLRTRPTKQHPKGRPLCRNALGNLLSNRYYLGLVVHKGEEFPGRHEALIEPELFDRVQAVLADQVWAGNRTRKWDHYLKGLLWCARCSKRLIVLKSKSANGRDYFYYICKGKQQRACDLPRLPMHQVEPAVAAHWATMTLTADELDAVRAVIERADLEFARTVTDVKHQITARLKQVDDAEQQCVDLLGDPAWPIEKLGARLEQLRTERAALESRLGEVEERPGFTDATEQLQILADLLTAPGRLYRAASEDEKKLLNQTCFTKLFLDSGEDRMPFVAREEFGPATRPFMEHLRNGTTEQGPAQGGPRRKKSATSCTSGSLVVDTGIEPVTPRV